MINLTNKLKNKSKTKQLKNNTLLLLIEAISNMSCESLELILDDNWYYDSTSKSTYIQKLKEVFDEFGKEDDFLISHQGQCNANECKNFNKNGYSFIGNKSGRYINFIIDLKENGSIKNIHNCFSFCTNEKVIDETKKQLKISIYEDEKLYFKPTENFTLSKNESIIAMNELKKFQDTSIPKNELIKWIEKYENLERSISGKDIFHKNQKLFWSCFLGIKELYNFILSEGDIDIAIDRFKSIQLNDDSKLLKWYSDYNYLFHKFRYLLPIIKKSKEENLKPGFLNLSSDFPVYYLMENLSKCFELQAIFHNHFYKKIKYYN
jgi:hypothetical protein